LVSHCLFLFKAQRSPVFLRRQSSCAADPIQFRAAHPLLSMLSWGGLFARLCACVIIYVTLAHGERGEREDGSNVGGQMEAVREKNATKQMEEYARAAISRIEREKFQLPLGKWWDGQPGSTRSLVTFLDNVHHLITVPERESLGYARVVQPTNGSGPSGRTAVIGDIHGQLWVLLPLLQIIRDDFAIFKEMQDGAAPIHDLGLVPQSSLFVCDDDLHYLFLGDYVDRGDRNLHTIILLLSYKVLCPHKVTLLQGNHEKARTNEKYGFKEELHYLFKADNGEVVRSYVNAVFSDLPFVATVSGVALAMHGGLTKGFMDACKDATPKGNLATCLPGTERAKEIGLGMTWSDPMPPNGPKSKDGFAFNSVRGAGEFFEPAALTDFLEAHGLRKLIRGHQMQEEGYNDQNGTITVFSAADYTTTFSQPDLEDGNKGAWMYVERGQDPRDDPFVPYKRPPAEFRNRSKKMLDGVFLELGSAASVDVHEHWARTEASDPGIGTLPELSNCTKVEGGGFSAEERAKYKALVHSIMTEKTAMELMDESGEASVNSMAEFCKALAKKEVVLEVFREMNSTIINKDRVLTKLQKSMEEFRERHTNS